MVGGHNGPPGPNRVNEVLSTESRNWICIMVASLKTFVFRAVLAARTKIYEMKAYSNKTGKTSLKGCAGNQKI